MILTKTETIDPKTGQKVTETITWYSPGEINYNYDQNIWIIANVYLEGCWPNSPLTSEGSQKTRTHCAPYETYCCVMAEFDKRMRALPEDAREALIDEIQGGIRDYRFLSRPAKRALCYISGHKRRRKSFSQWRYEQKQKKEKKCL